MKCVKCKRKTAIEGDKYCPMCEELLYEAYVERCEERKRRKQEEGEEVD